MTATADRWAEIVAQMHATGATVTGIHHTSTEPTPIHHRLTGHQVNLICRAADLPDWSGGRDRIDGDHPLEDADAPLAALVRNGRRLGTRRCLAVVGLTDRELHALLVAVAAVAPALSRDLEDYGDFVWHEPVQGVAGGVTYLLGIEVVK